jgi:F-type H+-transporting ATPase subunit a
VWSKSLSSDERATAGPIATDAAPHSNTATPPNTAPQTNTGTPTEASAAAPRSRRNFWLGLIGAVILLDIVAFFIVPPYAPGSPGTPVGGIADLIGANFELPAPHVVWDLVPNDPVSPGAIVFFHPSITASLLTMWIIMILIVVLAVLATRGLKLVPRGVQNAVELVYELLSNFAISLGGPAAKRYVPLFAGVFLFVLFSNWSGLLPIVGRLEFLRAPTSDVNVTLGLALVSFFIFQAEGFRRLGFRGYLGKFFSLKGFKEGPAAGLIGLYVGFIEFMLEFIKPITLAMRLFGNIFGGELAIGVITALTIAVVPVALLGLEVLLNFVQALIFSVLTLMYTLIAIESHDEEVHAVADFVEGPEGNMGPPLSSMEPAARH